MVKITEEMKQTRDALIDKACERIDTKIRAAAKAGYARTIFLIGRQNDVYYAVRRLYENQGYQIVPGLGAEEDICW